MNDWEESSVKINHIGMKQALDEGDTVDEIRKSRAQREPPVWVGQNPTQHEWEKKREKQIRLMRSNKTYQFIMILSGFTNEKMSRYWTRTEAANKQNAGGCFTGVQESNCSSGSCEIPVKKEKPREVDLDTAIFTYDEPMENPQQTTADAKRYHDWYVNTAWADGLVYLTPMVYGHIEEAFTALTQRFNHLQDVPLRYFIESKRVRSLFARVVAMCIRISDVLSGKKYHLESTYRRVHMERNRLMNTFKHVHLQGKELVFSRSDSNPRYASVNNEWDVKHALKLNKAILELNNNKLFLH